MAVKSRRWPRREDATEKVREICSQQFSQPVTTAQVFWSEFLGTAVLLLLGGGVVATNLLPKSKGKGGGWLMINFGWGLAVFAGVYVAFRTGGHLNPAVTIAKVVAYLFDPSKTLNGVPADKAGAVLVTGSNVAVYIIAQFLGAFVGAVLCWLTFKKHFDEDCDPALKLGVFSTGPEIAPTHGTASLRPSVPPSSSCGSSFPATLKLRLARLVLLLSSLSSVTPWVVPPDTQSTPLVTSVLVSLTRSCRSRVRVAPTGRTRGFPSLAPSSVLFWQLSSTSSSLSE